MTTPSKRSFWPYGIIIFFVVAVTYLVGFVLFALRNRIELVSDDYYAQEVQYQTHIDRVKRTQNLPEQPVFTLQDRRLTVTVPESLRPRMQQSELLFYRASDKSLDRRLPLAIPAPSADNPSLDLSTFASGSWDVQLTWMMDGENYYLDHKLVLPLLE